MKIFLNFTNAENLVLDLPDGTSAEDFASSFSITDSEDYHSFDDSDFNSNCYFFHLSWSLDNQHKYHNHQYFYLPMN